MIEGSKVLVTGAGGGIGRASALAFAQAGATAVGVIDVDEAGLVETVRQLAALDVEAHSMVVDVSNVAALAAAFRSMAATLGGLNIVHNNAGVVSGNPPWPDTPIEVIERVVRVNVIGTMVGTQVAIELLGQNGGGAIVNTSSIAGLAPMPTDAVYASTKAAITLFTQSCSAVKASHGVRVNAVLPGIVETSMVAKTGDGDTPAEWLQPILPLMEILEPEAIAAAVVELAGDESKAGQTVIVANEFRTPDPQPEAD